MIIVTIEDGRALQYCDPGMAAFARRHKLPWRTFKEQGLPAEILASIDDEMARAVIQQAKRRLNVEE